MKYVDGFNTAEFFALYKSITGTNFVAAPSPQLIIKFCRRLNLAVITSCIFKREICFRNLSIFSSIGNGASSTGSALNKNITTQSVPTKHGCTS